MSLKLVLRNLLAHPLRSLLTLGSVTLAVFLLCFLQATVRGLSATVESAATNRLWVQSAVSLFVNLPQAYQTKIASVEGVDWVTRFQWFGGLYQDRSNFFAQFGIDPETFLDSYPELSIVDGSYDEFERDRTGCLIGSGLRDQFGWDVGDRVPIIGTIFPRVDGEPWEFTVRGVYESSKPAIDVNTMYFDFEYLEESLESGAVSGPPGVGVYLVKTDDSTDPTTVMAGVDGLFENGPQRVQTTTEAEFNRQFISMLGSVPTLLGTIGAAVLFAIFFAVLNTMLMSARERVRDVGVIKALGFDDGTVARSFLIESSLLCVGGGLLGIGIVKLLEAPFSAVVSSQIPGFEIALSTLGFGFALAVALGLLTGIWPALSARRLSVVRALRAEV